MSTEQSTDSIFAPNGALSKPIPEFPGYFAGADGTIWSSRKRNGSPAATWRLRIPSADRRRTYLSIQFPRNKKMVTRYVHRVILEAFVGPCPPGMTACHNDGNPRNNNLQNLRWDTPHNNSLDKRRHGTMPVGSKHHNAKLNELGVKAVRALRAAGWSCRSISILFDVDGLTIWNIDQGISWTHVPH
jgi:hypothetical protein